MQTPTKPRHWLAAAVIGMTAQAVFPDMRRLDDPVPRPRTDGEARQAAAQAKRDRKNAKRLSDHAAQLGYF